MKCDSNVSVYRCIWISLHRYWKMFQYTETIVRTTFLFQVYSLWLCLSTVFITEFVAYFAHKSGGVVKLVLSLIQQVIICLESCFGEQ